MIELVSVQRSMFGEQWTREDHDILITRYLALSMVAHDIRDAINMRAETAIGGYAQRLVAASVPKA